MLTFCSARKAFETRKVSLSRAIPNEFSCELFRKKESQGKKENKKGVRVRVRVRDWYDDGAHVGTYDDDGYFHPEVHDWEDCDLEWPCDECCKLGQCHTKAGDSFQPTPAAYGAPIWDLPCPHCAK